MDLFSNEEKIELQNIVRTGFWRLELEEGAHPRLFADDVMDDLLGTSQEMTPEDRFDRFGANIHPDDTEIFADYSDSMVQGRRAELSYRYLHPTRGELMVRCGGRGVLDGPYPIAKGYHQDISDTVRMEQDLVQQRRLAERNMALEHALSHDRFLMDEVLQLQTCGILVYTLPNRDILMINDEAKRIYGMDPKGPVDAASIGRQLSHAVYDDAENTKNHLKNLVPNGDSYAFTAHFRADEGNPLHVWIKTKKLCLSDGQELIVSSIQDVSQMTALRQAKDELEQMSQQLETALVLAEQGSRAKTAFLFNMSHDIRTPMNAIIGYIELLDRCLDDAVKRADYMAKLRDSSTVLLALINDVLEMSRIERGLVVLEEQIWDAVHFNDTLFSLVEGMMRDKGITFVKTVDIIHDQVYCDSVKLKEIFLNILSNAAKYTKPGGEVRMDLRELPSDKPGFALFQTTISDTGVGMGEDFLPHLFEEFSREDTDYVSGVQGTGLGMAIVGSLVELMGGTIGVESAQGVGTTFTICLYHRIAEQEMSQDRTSGTADIEVLAGKQLLLVEDNELNAEIAMELLKDVGILVDWAHDGVECLECLNERPVGTYDLVLMDVQMPRMNGYEATRAIRALPDERLARIPVVAMTANAFAEDRIDAQEAGMDAHLAKPVDVKAMMELLAGFFD